MSRYLEFSKLINDASSSLTTVVLSSAAGLGYIGIKDNLTRTFFTQIVSTFGFFSAIFSGYISARLAYSLSFLYGSESQFDVLSILKMFDIQIFTTLIATSALGAVAFRITLK